jgi:hypothetical protein
MKKVFFTIATAAALLFVLSVCGDQLKSTVTYTVNEPVYMPYSDFRSAKAAKPAQKMVNPGKICLYGDYIFINEVSKGIHIVDNSNPAAPNPVAFIDLLGNIDIAIKNDILYADSYIDLVWFDLANPSQPVACGRAENVFANALPPTGNDYPVKEIDWTKGVIIEWEVKTITEKEEYHHYYPLCPGCYYFGLSSDKLSWNTAGSFSSAGGTSFTSVTGSMSRFAVYGDYLYVVNNNMLKVFSLSENSVIKGYEQYLSWNVETIFPYNQKLFLGTTSGMMIYSLTDPAKPAYLSSLAHVVGCDPVVVQGNYAYVTIRNGNSCGQNRSFLDVIDISNPAAPVQKASFDMNEPYGLGIDGNTLFVCDEGLSIFDATNPVEVGSKKIKHFASIHGYDVIPYNGKLILIGNDGMYQYDYSDIQNIKELSALKIEKK